MPLLLKPGYFSKRCGPKKARVLHWFTRPSYAVMFDVATLCLSELVKCIASTKIRSDAVTGLLVNLQYHNCAFFC